MFVLSSIGSNTFDILVCLGFPWLVKSILNGMGVGNVSSHLAGDFLVPVNSEGLAYTVISLLLSLIILYVILLLSKFELTKFTALICLVIYVVFFTGTSRLKDILLIIIMKEVASSGNEVGI